MGLKSIAVASGVLAFALAQNANAQSIAEVADLFGRADAIGSPMLSPDGKNLAVSCSPAAKLATCVFDLNTGASTTVPAIAGMRVTDHFWGNSETLILNTEAFETVKTSSGVKDFGFERAVSFNLKTKKPVMLLSDNRAYLDTNNLAGILPAEPGKLLYSIVTLEGGDKDIGDLVVQEPRPVYNLLSVDLKTGKSSRLSSKPRFIQGAIHGPKGEFIAELGYREVSKGQHTVSVKSGDKVIYERANLQTNPLSVWGLDATGKDLIVFFDEGTPYGLHRMSLADGTLTPIVLDASEDGGLVVPVIDSRSLRVVGFEFPGDATKQLFEDAALKSQLATLKKSMPTASVTLASWTDDRKQSVVRVMEGERPAEYFLFEADKGELSPLGSIAPQLKDKPLGQTTAVKYAARDGLQIEAYLTLPPGKTKASGPFPLILLPHGGPEARDTLQHDWWAKAYASAGYAVLQPNFRGSSGYGTDFLEAGYGEFGDKMVTDVLDGAAWAVSQGLAKPGEVCAAGASYGGYSALMMGLKDSKSVKCVVAVNALTNPFSFLGDTRVGGFAENYLERYLGADRFSGAAARDGISPVRLAGNLSVPVLLIAGKQDTTVPFDQSEQFKRAAAGKPVELFALEGEDHYLRSARARYDVLQQSLTFLQKHLPAK